MTYGDRHLQRTSERGPSTGSYFTVGIFLPLTGDVFQFAMPMDARLVEISRYTELSSSGTITVANTTQSVTWLSAGALTTTTTTVTAAATIATAGSQACTKGDLITVTAGGTTATNDCIVLTFWARDHVAAAEAND